ncbi:MAG TPA: Hsp20/alpha crystallin family protein [Acidimicrobiales bacterium]|jgi:HSP20 family protein|nr:Hsp20/alpha crystallin family protein [Acidimicrobiales bacterium]
MLMRFDPFRELDRLTELQNRNFPTSMLAMDAFRQGHEFVIQLDLPGADPSTIGLSVEKNVLTVRAERTAAKTEVDEVIVTERRYGSFSRQLFLGESLDTDQIRASYDNGVLTITIPVAEKAKPRQIQIDNVSSSATPVEAQSTDTTTAGTPADSHVAA